MIRGSVRFTIHDSRFTRISLGAILLALSFLLFNGRTAAQEPPSSLVVDADQVVYDQATQKVEATGNVRLRYKGTRLSADYALFDLKEEQLTARGRVVMIDSLGRELRGEVLTFDARTNEAQMLSGESTIDHIYIRGDRLQMLPNRIFAFGATLTTCDPAKPLYRITARQIEIIPGDRVIARSASLWLGSYKLFTLPIYVMSLGDEEEVPSILPGVGYDSVNGLWLDYRYPYRAGTVRASLYTKYGLRTGIMPLNTLKYRTSRYVATLKVGRTQDTNFKIFDQTEAIFSVRPQMLGSLPLFFSSALQAGWFNESSSAVQTSRFLYLLSLATPTIPVGSNSAFDGFISWQDARYGTGDHQGVFAIDTGFTYFLTDTSAGRSQIRLGYALEQVSGASPFSFDTITPLSKVTLSYVQVKTPTSTFSTRFGTGIAYNFLGQELITNISYGQREVDRFHWDFGVEYSITTQVLKLSSDSGLSLGYGTYLTVQATYNTTTQRFETLDYFIKSRLCDCIDILLKYSQVSEEIWFVVGLTAYPEARLQVQFQRP